jgi:autotransporter-associated beta strand protein
MTMNFTPSAKVAALGIFAICMTPSAMRAQTVLIDFGNSNSFRGASQVGADANGNYWTSVDSGAYFSGVVDVTGTNTSIGFGFSTAGGTDSFNGPAGATTNPITQQQLDNVQIDSTALGLLGGSDAAAIDYYTDSTFVLQGLNSSLTYDLTFFGSHKFNANNVTRYSTYTDNTFSNVVSSTTLNVGVGSAQNQSNVATLTGLAAQTNNTLYVGFAGDGGTGSGYLNALSLYGYLGFRSGGTNTLNSGSTYVAIGNYTNGDSRSVDTVIGEGTTVQVNNASGIYFNSTLVMTNGGGTIERGTNFTIYALTGAGDLDLTGTNSLTISKGGNYSGTLSMTGGTLTLNANGGLGTGDLELNGGSLVVNAAQGLGTGTITVASGTTTLNNSSALTALTGNNNFVLGGNSATFQVWGNGQVLNLGTGNVSVTGFNNLNAFSGGMQFDGIVSGSGTLNWYGSGSLVLGGANTFSGTINAGANGGSLVLSNVNALQNTTLNKGTNHNVVFGLSGSNTYNLGGLTGAGNIVLSNGNSLNVNSSAGSTYSGALSDSGSLTKSGSGTLTLSGANSHSGGTTLSAGQLNINNASALGTGTFALGDGASFDNTSGGALTNSQNNAISMAGTSTFLGSSSLNLGAGTVTLGDNSQLNVTGALRLGGNISGSSTLTKAGNGTLTLAGTNFGSSQLVVTAGTLALTDANRGAWVNTNGAVRLEGGTLSLANGNNLGALPGSPSVQLQFAGNSTLLFAASGLIGGNRLFAISNGVTATIDVQSFTPTMSNAVQGGGTLAKTGAGALTLAGANTHAGGTTLSAGLLNLRNASALGTGTFTMANGTSFDNTATGSISNANNNAIVLGETNTFVGTSSLDLGTGNVTFAANTRLNVNSNNLTLGGNLSGSSAFSKDGAGTLTLAGSNAMTSFVVVDFGILNLANVDALANAQLYLYGSAANKTVAFGVDGANTYNLGALSGEANGTLSLGANSINIGAGNLTTAFNGVIEGTGAVTKVGTGTFTLAGANTHSGGTTLSSGQLNINNPAALGTGTFAIGGGVTFDNTSGGAISNANNNAITIVGTNVFTGSNELDLGTGDVTFSGNTRLNVSGGSLTMGGDISGADPFNKDGGGTLTLAGSNSMTSFVVVDFGILNLANVDALANAQLYLYDSSTNKAVTFGAAGTNTYNLGALSGEASGTLSLGANSVNVGGADLTTTFNGLIEGTGGLAKSGTGTLTLSAANTYSGQTIVQSGSLKVSDAAALGATNGSTTVESGATLEVSGGISVAENITISGEGVGNGGAIRSLGDGENTLAGTITLGGDARINAASPTGSLTTLQSLGSSSFLIDTNVTLATYSQSAAAVQLTAAALGDSLAGLFSTTNNWSSVTSFGLRLSVDGSNPDLPYTVKFYDSNLDEVASYSGSTYGIGTNAATAMLELLATGVGSAADIVGMDFTWDGSGTITNNLFDIVQVPTSSLTISGNIDGGNNVLLLGAEGTANSSSIGGNISLSGAVSGAGNTNTLSSTVTSLYKDGAGTVTLSGANTYTGDTRIAAGTLTVAAGGSLGSGSDAFVSLGATLNIQTNTTVATVQENGSGDGGTVNLGGGATLTVNGADKGTVYQSAITGQGNLALAASGNTVLTLYGDNSFTGNVNITGGTLAASGAGSNQALKSITSLTVGSGATLLLGSSDQVRNTAFVTLSGGTIQRAAGVSEVFGALDLNAASFLDFGTGATGTLSFGSYTPSSLLTINNFLPGNVLTFGSNLGSSINDTGLFSFSSGFTSDWDSGTSTFTITAIPEPSTVIAALALLMLMIWPARRRLMLDTLSIPGLRRVARE